MTNYNIRVKVIWVLEDIQQGNHQRAQDFFVDLIERIERLEEATTKFVLSEEQLLAPLGETDE